MRKMTVAAALAAGLGLGVLTVLGSTTSALAQGFASADPYNSEVVDRVTVRIANPSADAGVNARV